MAKTQRLLTSLVAIGLAFLLMGTVAAYRDRTEIEGYTIDLVEVTKNGNQSTWVYAVTAGESVSSTDLSHWSLGIGSCYEVVVPFDGDTYTTPTGGYGCGSFYTCTQGIYKVEGEAGGGGVPTVPGIKFEAEDHDEFPPLGLSNQTTHVFTLTIQKEGDQEFRIGDAYLDMKGGGWIDQGEIDGPVCYPNPVTIASLEARGHPEKWGIVGLVGGVIAGIGWRKRSSDRGR